MDAGKSEARREYERKLTIATRDDIADICGCDGHDGYFQRKLRDVLPRLLETLEGEGVRLPVH